VINCWYKNTGVSASGNRDSKKLAVAFKTAAAIFSTMRLMIMNAGNVSEAKKNA
jgi:hypothetical protein